MQPKDWEHQPRQLPKQAWLFSLTFDDLLEQGGVSSGDWAQWYADGLISFPPDRNRHYDPYHLSEIRFVSGLERSGLAVDERRRLLQDLPRPYRYDPERTAFNFFLKQWQQIPEPGQARFQEIFDSFLETAVNGGDAAALDDLIRRAQEARDKLSGRGKGRRVEKPAAAGPPRNRQP